MGYLRDRRDPGLPAVGFPSPAFPPETPCVLVLTLCDLHSFLPPPLGPAGLSFPLDLWRSVSPHWVPTGLPPPPTPNPHKTYTSFPPSSLIRHLTFEDLWNSGPHWGRRSSHSFPQHTWAAMAGMLKDGIAYPPSSTWGLYLGSSKGNCMMSDGRKGSPNPAWAQCVGESRFCNDHNFEMGS